MRIDTHAHLMLRPMGSRAPSDPEKLLSDWAECGIDGGWISSIDAIYTRNLT
jgi:hypothetical protein